MRPLRVVIDALGTGREAKIWMKERWRVRWRWNCGGLRMMGNVSARPSSPTLDDCGTALGTKHDVPEGRGVMRL